MIDECYWCGDECDGSIWGEKFINISFNGKSTGFPYTELRYFCTEDHRFTYYYGH